MKLNPIHFQPCYNKHKKRNYQQLFVWISNEQRKTERLVVFVLKCVCVCVLVELVSSTKTLSINVLLFPPFKIAQMLMTHWTHRLPTQNNIVTVNKPTKQNPIVCVREKVIHFKLISFISYIFLFSFAETPLWLLLQVAPIRNERDLVVLLLLTFRDITAFKQLIDAEDTKSGKISQFYKPKF